MPDPKLLFSALASFMVVVALCFVLPLPGRRVVRDRALLDGAAPPVPQAGLRVRRWTAAALVLALPAAAVILYLMLGDPAALSAARTDLSDQVLGAGPATAPVPNGQAYAELERHLQRQPGDARALVLKARQDMQAQRFELAAAGYRKALEGPSKVARDAAVWVEYAEARGMLQGGTLAGPPQQLVAKALSLDASNPQALDLAGSAAWEQRDFVAASRHWKLLLEQMAPGSARHAELVAAIERADQRARFSLPPARP